MTALASNEKEPLMTADQVAARLNVPVGTVRQWVKFRKIPVQRVNGRNRFDPAEIEAWLEAQKRPVAA